MYSYSPHHGYTRYDSLRGRAVFITGGASGIGASLVEAFVTQGAAVAFVDMDQVCAEELCQKLVQQGFERPWFQLCDVRDVTALRRSIHAAQTVIGDITVLINNAGNDQRYDARAITEEQWLDGMAINLHPAFFASQTVQPMMAAQGGGVILNLSSINAQFGPPNLASYITAKAGVLGITRALATDFGGDNIRVNAILPGWVATPKQLEKWLTPEQEAEWMSRLCLKKRLAAHDVAKLALFLAADDAAMITAQQFVVDGGHS